MKTRDEIELEFQHRFTVSSKDGLLPYAGAKHVVDFAIQQVNAALEKAAKEAERKPNKRYEAFDHATGKMIAVAIRSLKIA